jgi:hypothetical protein
VNSSLTTITILVTLLHIAALGVMLWIRVRRSEADWTHAGTPAVQTTPCAVCGDPASEWSYDGLDPNEQRDPHTGHAWSADMSHYRRVCAAHLLHAMGTDGRQGAGRESRVVPGGALSPALDKTA